jgi:hypothetical protein
MQIILTQSRSVTSSLRKNLQPRRSHDKYCEKNTGKCQLVNGKRFENRHLLGVLAYLTAFTSFWGYLVNLMMGLNFAFIVVSIAAIIFPYRKKELYQKSPIASWKLLGTPSRHGGRNSLIDRVWVLRVYGLIVPGVRRRDHMALNRFSGRRFRSWVGDLLRVQGVQAGHRSLTSIRRSTTRIDWVSVYSTSRISFKNQIFSYF